jgi:predicted amino acid racemase
LAYPHLTIDLDKIEHNARAIVGLCEKHGITVTGVTKGVCGLPELAEAMLRGGVISIGESRIENIRRLHAANVATDIMQLRLPSLSGADEIVTLANVSLNSELAVLEALSQAAARQRRVHEVIVMVDLGDLREGIMPDELHAFVGAALNLPGIRVVGLGTNLACFAGVVPSEENMTQLVELATGMEAAHGLSFRWISGANSSGFELIASGRMPKKINHARIGEAILLGRETVHRRPLPGTFQDAFVLYAEVLELKIKPSIPVGERTKDAFGRRAVFVDKGERLRALLNIGREDIDIEGLVPIDPGVAVLWGSSGYLAVDVADMKRRLQVGDELTFIPNYSALLMAMTSGYVMKRPLRGGALVDGR